MTASKRSQLDRLRRTLSERDWDILHDLARLRLMSVRQIERLHITATSSLARARRARAVMQRLHELGLVVRLERRVGGVHAGSAGHVYTLSALGQRITQSVDAVGEHRVRQPWEPSAPFVDHILAVTELYVELRESERQAIIAELDFEAEPQCWRVCSASNGQQLVVKPDAFVHFVCGSYEYSYFVEVDRATQSRTVIRRKGEVYVDYFLSGHEQREHELFPQVLFVTTTEQRREQIMDALGSVDAEHWQLFQVQLDRDAFSGVLRPPPERLDSVTN
jgi:hypothetical protein